MTPEEFIAHIMQSRGLSTKRQAVIQAAGLLCISPTSVWQWLSGRQRPSRQSLRMMALVVENDTLNAQRAGKKKPRRGKAAPEGTRPRRPPTINGD